MAKITTRDALREYILRTLGAPYINVEVSEDHLDDAIDLAIEMFSEFAFDGQLTETVIVELTGKGTYLLPDGITSIIKIAQGSSGSGLANFGGNYGSGFVPDRWSEQFFSSGSGITGIVNSIIGISTTNAILDKFYGDDLNFEFNEYTNSVKIFEPYAGSVLVHYTYEYLPTETGDKIFGQKWVKAFAVANARMMQSTVTGKYSSPLVGGAMINYGEMRQLAEQEIQQLKEDLQLQYAGPAPISIA